MKALLHSLQVNVRRTRRDLIAGVASHHPCSTRALRLAALVHHAVGSAPNHRCDAVVPQVPRDDWKRS